MHHVRGRWRLRWVITTVVVWAALSVLGTWALSACWLGGEASASAWTERSAVKLIANVADTVLLPVWGAWWVVTGRLPGHESIAVFALANAAGWAMWLAGAWAVVLTARWCVRARISADRGNGAMRAALRLAGPPDSGRRRFLAQGPAALGGAVGLVVLPKSTLIDPLRIEVRRYTVPVRDLPAELSGLRIAQLSDTHAGPRVPAWFIERAVGLALDLRPDVFALTGDYIHYGARYIALAADLFRPLTSSGVPVVGVLGNHDWYGAGGRMRAALEAIGVAMIDNGRVFYGASSRAIARDATAGPALCLAGLGDLLEDEIDLDAALAGVPPEMPRVVLAHHPDTAEVPDWSGPNGPRHRIDLMLSGHTHGGQVRLPGIGAPMVPSRFGQKYAGGLAEGPWCRVLVSRGIGTSILPVRFGVPPEVVEITLTRA